MNTGGWIPGAAATMADGLGAALERGRRAGALLAALLLCGCAAGVAPLGLPEGHPAHPRTPGSSGSMMGTDPSVSVPMDSPQDPAAVSYACPMHPEVVSASPGRCPKCGMVLRAVPGGREGGDR